MTEDFVLQINKKYVVFLNLALPSNPSPLLDSSYALLLPTLVYNLGRGGGRVGGWRTCRSATPVDD